KAATKKRRAGDGCEDCRPGATEGAVTGDVAREGRRDERLLLIREPVRGKYPVDAAVLIGGIRRLAGPGENDHRADGQPLMPSAERGRCRGHYFDEVWHERQAVRVIRHATRIAGLAELTHVADRLDGTPAIVLAL